LKEVPAIHGQIRFGFCHQGEAMVPLELAGAPAQNPDRFCAPHLHYSSPRSAAYHCCMTLLQRAIEESVVATRALGALEQPLKRAAKLVLQCLTSGHKLLVCGNGGSASDATHVATEFLCRYCDDRRPYPAISLTANGEYLTAVCNDYHADEIFARQVWGLGARGDLLIAFTSSGKSSNVLRALEEANKKKMKSICFLGRDGGFTKGVATVDLLAPGASTARIQEAQTLLFHVLCETVDRELPK
jgi:D-sedoheptulose 7-phosphate isomerase